MESRAARGTSASLTEASAVRSSLRCVVHRACHPTDVCCGCWSQSQPKEEETQRPQHTIRSKSSKISLPLVLNPCTSAFLTQSPSTRSSSSLKCDRCSWVSCARPGRPALSEMWPFSRSTNIPVCEMRVILSLSVSVEGRGCQVVGLSCSIYIQSAAGSHDRHASIANCLPVPKTSQPPPLTPSMEETDCESWTSCPDTRSSQTHFS